MATNTPELKSASERFLQGWRLRVARDTLTAHWITPEGEPDESVGYNETVKIITALGVDLDHTSEPRGITYFGHERGP